MIKPPWKWGGQVEYDAVPGRLDNLLDRVGSLSAFTSRRRMDFVQSAFAIANYTKLWFDNLLFPRKSWLAETTISCFLGEKLKHFIEKNSKWALDPTLKDNSNKHYITILHHNIDILYFILFSNFIESGLVYRKCWLENLWSTQMLIVW